MTAPASRPLLLALLLVATLLVTLSAPSGPTGPSRAVATEPKGGETARILGTWRGRVYGDEGAPAGYRARVRITRNSHGNPHARIRYPGYCRGRWKFVGHAGKRFRFDELITTEHSVCVSDVRVKVRRRAKKLVVRWREPSGDRAHMRARRVR
ncbi:hypothetical protein [Nocardioides acrostichi]|uniref:Lipocalin-like domain-containing protein n=1 Tax=Nocardioides acrostichi TaxID=2784339 RepID=A0A930Y9J7_9ACTN|nr:hypothetical protein [Nocardioides acrostichi]MBF4160433.1 hypothetical protein [Nocardioides acrostichi]